MPVLLDWMPLHGEGAVPPPVQHPVLVRTELNPVRHYHVAIFMAGFWRMSGAQDRIIYGVDAWSEIVDDAD
jgi:hypothetical protein